MKTSRFLMLGLFIPSVLLNALLSGCAYRIGMSSRSLPGGYKYLSIPVFKNSTQETGIEVGFTNALIQEFERSKVGKVTTENLSDVKIVGVIQSIQYLPGTKRTAGESAAPYLPLGTVLASDYRILVAVKVSIIRQSDNTQIWVGDFAGERTYNAPLVTLAGVNSVNPLYNLSARRQNIDFVANDMMAEAHDRITENF
ncbi:MAG: LPS assembly lipoprotein LptE [Pseudobdellovibrionaceae bacterium]